MQFYLSLCLTVNKYSDIVFRGFFATLYVAFFIKKIEKNAKYSFFLLCFVVNQNLLEYYKSVKDKIYYKGLNYGNEI